MGQRSVAHPAPSVASRVVALSLDFPQVTAFLQTPLVMTPHWHEVLALIGGFKCGITRCLLFAAVLQAPINVAQQHGCNGLLLLVAHQVDNQY
jgi:hypothetical protein